LSDDGASDIWASGTHIMKRRLSQNAEAFTRVELFVVLGVVALMAALALSALPRMKQKGWRIQCTDNLKQLGLAYRTWAIDNAAESSPLVTTNRGGAYGSLPSMAAFRYFQAISNIVGSPKVLVCPADIRVPATDFGPGFSNTNLSYFAGLDADEKSPQMFLYGDRNLTNGLPVQDGILLLVPNRPVGWNHGLHYPQGNIALADGSVQGWTSSRIPMLSVGTTNRLAMP
jgi:type II secretory pathway pseudopilin PulG